VAAVSPGPHRRPYQRGRRAGVLSGPKRQNRSSRGTGSDAGQVLFQRTGRTITPAGAVRLRGPLPLAEISIGDRRSAAAAATLRTVLVMACGGERSIHHGDLRFGVPELPPDTVLSSLFTTSTDSLTIMAVYTCIHHQ